MRVALYCEVVDCITASLREAVFDFQYGQEMLSVSKFGSYMLFLLPRPPQSKWYHHALLYPYKAQIHIDMFLCAYTHEKSVITL